MHWEILVMIGVVLILVFGVRKLAQKRARRRYQHSYLCGLCSVGTGLFFSPTGKVIRIYQLSKKK